MLKSRKAVVMDEQVRKIAEREVGGLSADIRRELVFILRNQVLAEGSHLHCFLEWLDLKDADIICIRQPKEDY